MSRHVVQSPEWGKFKSSYGTTAVQVGDIQYTKHHIPMTDKYFAYCPKVDPNLINFSKLHKSLIENNCISANFDVPNVIKGTHDAEHALDIFHKNKCVKAPRDQFAKSNIILDLTKSDEQLLSSMHSKHRYNLRYAQRNSVVVREAETQKDFDIFYEMFNDTAIRQKYYVRPKGYYQKIWDLFRPSNMAHILIGEYQGVPLAGWMLFVYENILYYPYGGSSEKHKNLFGSTLVAWEAMRLGKRLNCHTFDMWGAGDDVNDTSDPWWGFTNFKIKFGGNYVKYMDSYDFVVNEPIYRMFSVANDLRWKVLHFLK